MKGNIVQQLTLYKYRYKVGFGLFFIALIFLTTFAITSVPHGLSEAEMNSAAAAGQLSLHNFKPEMIIDLPYHGLQKLSMWLFNVSTLSIRLPSIVLAIASGTMLVLMLRRWFSDNIAIVSGIMAISTVLFLAIARSGSPMIMGVFLTLVLLLAATRILHAEKWTLLWKIYAIVAIILSLYSPLGIYPVIIYFIAAILHPRVRLLIRKLAWWQIAIGIISALLIASPLIIAALHDSSITTRLLGFDASWHPMAAFSAIGNALFGLREGVYAGYMTPAITMVGMLIVAMGFAKTIVEFHSARSYLILSWLVILTPLILLEPSRLYMLFAPLVLLMAIGTETLIREWYRLFPRNPYARMTALIPLTILIGGLVFTTADRYFLANRYDSQIVYSYDQQFEAVRHAVNQRSAHNMNLVVAPDQYDFYQLLAREYDNLNVTIEPSTDYNSLIMTRQAFAAGPDEVPTSIVTNGQSHQSLMLRIYEK